MSTFPAILAKNKILSDHDSRIHDTLYIVFVRSNAGISRTGMVRFQIMLTFL